MKKENEDEIRMEETFYKFRLICKKKDDGVVEKCNLELISGEQEFMFHVGYKGISINVCGEINYIVLARSRVE